jgi:hypothetical protein
MREIIILLVHLFVTLARLARPSGLRSVVAESVLLRHQLLILNRAPNLRATDRIIAGLCTLFLRPPRILRAAIALRPSTLLHLHNVLKKRKYRISENPMMPDPSALALVLEAVLAVRALRTDGGWGLDRYYLGNLGLPDGASFHERQYDPQLVPQVVGRLLQELRESSSRPKPTFVGRNFFVALRDEMLADVVTLNRVLEPFLGRLFRLAAHGHWIRERRPVRGPGEAHAYASHMPPAATEGLALVASSNTEGEIQLELIMDSRGVSYTVGHYSEIREFAPLVEQLEPGRIWNGLHFQASADPLPPSQSGRFHLLRSRDGVKLTFGGEEWERLRCLLSTVLARPSLQAMLEDLSLRYGEL